MFNAAWAAWQAGAIQEKARDYLMQWSRGTQRRRPRPSRYDFLTHRVHGQSQPDAVAPIPPALPNYARPVVVAAIGSHGALPAGPELDNDHEHGHVRSPVAALPGSCLPIFHDGKISQVGSYNFPVPETGLCPKHARLYLDMLYLLARVCQHEKEVNLGRVRAWHNEVKKHMDFHFRLHLVLSRRGAAASLQRQVGSSVPGDRSPSPAATRT